MEGMGATGTMSVMEGMGATAIEKRKEIITIILTGEGGEMRIIILKIPPLVLPLPLVLISGEVLSLIVTLRAIVEGAEMIITSHT